MLAKKTFTAAVPGCFHCHPTIKGHFEYHFSIIFPQVSDRAAHPVHVATSGKNGADATRSGVFRSSKLKEKAGPAQWTCIFRRPKDPASRYPVDSPSYILSSPAITAGFFHMADLNVSCIESR